MMVWTAGKEQYDSVHLDSSRIMVDGLSIACDRLMFGEFVLKNVSSGFMDALMYRKY